MTDHWATLRPVIEQAIVNQPRSLQTRIGPSEIGTPCSACLVCKLAGAPKIADSLPWLPFIGTCVHTQLEGIFAADDRWLTEQEVTVGEIGGQPITGHADLYDTATGTVYDWKIVGKTTLDAVRRKGLAAAKPTYQVQRHLYGVGFEAAGYPVNEVVAVFLPRNHISIDALHIDSAPFDRTIAEAGLTRANNAHAYLTQHGLDAALAYVGGHDGSDYDCARYPQMEKTA